MEAASQTDLRCEEGVCFRKGAVGMISRINLLKKKEGMSAEDFAAYLTQHHGNALAAMPSLKGCEANVVVDNEQRSPFDRGSIEIDGYTEMFFDSYGDMLRDVAAAQDALEVDYAQFAESAVPALIAVKKVDKPVPSFLSDVKLIKRMSFLGRKEGVSAATWQREWWEMHSALVKTMTGYAGYNQNLVIDRIVDGAPASFDQLPVEGIVEFWFENMNAFDECYGTPAFKRTGAHGAEFIDNITTYLVEATPIVAVRA